MEADFWHHKWANNEIAFHNAEAHPLPVKHVAALGLAPGARIFLPLCGKTLDIRWLLECGYRVAGAELSRVAVEQLFAELDVEPTIAVAGNVTRYSAPDLDIFVGDIFNVSRDLLGPLDAIYDRAALVALPPPTRERYAAHLVQITGNAPQLLVCFEYDQSQLDGPPFAVWGEEVLRHYRGRYQPTLLESVELAGGLKGKVAATENVWLLQR